MYNNNAILIRSLVTTALAPTCAANITSRSFDSIMSGICKERAWNGVRQLTWILVLVSTRLCAAGISPCSMQLWKDNLIPCSRHDYTLNCYTCRLKDHNICCHCGPKNAEYCLDYSEFVRSQSRWLCIVSIHFIRQMRCCQQRWRYGMHPALVKEVYIISNPSNASLIRENEYNLNVVDAIPPQINENLVTERCLAGAKSLGAVIGHHHDGTLNCSALCSPVSHFLRKTLKIEDWLDIDEVM